MTEPARQRLYKPVLILWGAVGLLLALGCGTPAKVSSTSAGTGVNSTSTSTSTSEDTATPRVMPDVVGKQLDAAKSDIQSAGFKDKVEVIGGGTLGVVVDANWKVCVQAPEAGQALTSAPKLTVDRSCAESKVLTVENSQALRELLSGPAAGESVKAFGEQYGRGKATIAFDGHITYLLASERPSYSTAYVVAGDAGAAPAGGPTFVFTPVTLPPTSPMQQKDLAEGQNIRITAKVGHFEHIDADPLVEEINRMYLLPDSLELR